MDKTAAEFMQRNLPDFKDSFIFEFEKSDRDFFQNHSPKRKNTC